MRKRPRNTRGPSTSTSTEVRSPTKTSTATDAYTRGNVTVTGGAGAGATTRVTIKPKSEARRGPIDETKMLLPFLGALALLFLVASSPNRSA